MINTRDANSLFFGTCVANADIFKTCETRPKRIPCPPLCDAAEQVPAGKWRRLAGQGLVLLVLGWVLSVGAGAAAGEADATVLEQLAGKVKPGTWLDVTDQMQGFERGLWSPIEGGRSILNFGARGSWDPITKQVLFISMGGPRDTARFLGYSAASNRWSIRLDPGWFAVDKSSGGHRLNTNAVDPGRSLFYYQSPAGPIRCCDLRQDTWSTLPAADDSAAGRATAFVYVPDFDGLVGFFGDQVRLWHVPNRTWSLLATLPDRTPMHFAEYHPQHKLVYFGRVRGAPMYKLDLSKTVTRLTDAPVPLKFGNGHVRLDPRGGLFVVPYKRAEDNIVLFTFDVLKDRWQEHKDVEVPEELFSRTMSVSIPTYDVLMYATLRNVFLYKHPQVGE